MKKFAVVAALLLSSSLSMATDDDTRVIKFAATSPKGTPPAIGMELFARKVQERSDGKIKVRTCPNGVLGGDVQVLSSLQGGVVEMMTWNAGLMLNHVTDFGTLDFPFLHTDTAKVDAMLDGEVGKMLTDQLPPLAIFALVIGSIYSGFATASESAALGVLSVLGLWRRAFTWQRLGQAFEATLRTTGMIIFITLSAFFLNFVLASIGLTTTLVNFVSELNLSPTPMLLAIILFYIVLGCFMDTLAMLITTAPLIVPIVVALGFNPLWFGVVLIVLCEMGQITPPFGMNLFVVQSIRGRGNFMDVVYGALPFCLALLVLIALLIAFPQLAPWLPKTF